MKSGWENPSMVDSAVEDIKWDIARARTRKDLCRHKGAIDILLQICVISSKTWEEVVGLVNERDDELLNLGIE